MRVHIDSVAAALGSPAPQADPLDPLRQALQLHAPVPPAPRRAHRLFTELLSPTSSATRAP
jgi:hypothetical protein